MDSNSNLFDCNAIFADVVDTLAATCKRISPQSCLPSIKSSETNDCERGDKVEGLLLPKPGIAVHQVFNQKDFQSLDDNPALLQQTLEEGPLSQAF